MRHRQYEVGFEVRLLLPEIGGGLGAASALVTSCLQNSICEHSKVSSGPFLPVVRAKVHGLHPAEVVLPSSDGIW